MIHGFILIFGTRPVKSQTRDGMRETIDCPGCGLLSEMREHRLRDFFTIFFIPVIPMGSGRSIMVCSRCGFSYDPENQFRPQTSEASVISCKHCGQKLRVPAMPGRHILITCSHCERKFDVKL
jgi:DNA-directed RNA polymerase subunit RPC12/RpoP